ncbi:alanine--tRNA ligase [Candidatus Uhrbacteria bacterium CG10_big_fil_rev_8_21_14_0_10_48_16]|uniref:alanine--tRNA ligase n=1 Tax=Candidatus Uhrbacteria bacterium CG10_big_fil_rev_8_21_14_0_10_48_16 TaxID=1975038 RepID=A0A2M8LGA8_9BACT|nr:MAG: alanine--tRNA ligase [Candidatus Uhrbacteria bacterium CG10_big_fil_rev_8_21_14_0_10_48_16]
MTIHEIRTKYLKFFEERGHVVIPSASLLPENDPTTLFTGSGMQPMVPYLLGEAHPQGVRLADSQKCFRSQDIEEVGDNRHTTFFEMLGNWSLGDYFKEEQIPWMFEFLTQTIGLDPQNLYVTVFRGNAQISKDEEAVGIWKKVFSDVGIEALDVDFSERDGMQGGRIFYYDETKNWWSRSGTPDKMPVGEPGGPDSEMFWDFGMDLGIHERSEFKDLPCHVNCDCGRFLEIGNNVFMEYKKTEDGFERLPQKNVDFGGGLIRIAAALNGNPDIFAVDAFQTAKEALESLSSASYESSPEITRSMRVILDHVCAATFLIGDDVFPSNKDQGYFVRRLIRRAVRFGKKLGIDTAFVSEIGSLYIREYQKDYVHLKQKEDRILEELAREEEKFSKTLLKGEREFEKMFSQKGKISGEDAFILYSTYGFPIELSEEMAEEQGQHVDRTIFMEEFRKHQDLSRSGSTQKFAGGLADHSDATVKLHTATHMLHQALRTVLGEHVEQKGSNITSDRLRFDFSHAEKMTQEQIQAVEDLVNQQIEKDLLVHFEMLSLEQAKERGAIGLFEDKYSELGDQIKVYFIGDEATGGSYSKEVCGGPHVEHTGILGHFKISKEESASSGVRRIKAVLE